MPGCTKGILSHCKLSDPMFEIITCMYSLKVMVKIIIRAQSLKIDLTVTEHE